MSRERKDGGASPLSESKPRKGASKILDEIALRLELESDAFTISVQSVNPNVAYRAVGVFEVCDDGIIVENDNGGRALLPLTTIASIEIDGD